MGDVDESSIVWSIVVADDDELTRTLVVRHLQRLRLRNPVVEAVDGDAACEILASLRPAPVLLLLDLDMPGRSGLEVLKWVRSNSDLADLAVVMLTGSAELDQVEAAFALGIASYLVKPVGFGALEDVLRQLGFSWAIMPAALSPQGRPT